MELLRSFLRALTRHFVVWLAAALFLAPALYLVAGAFGTDLSNPFLPVSKAFALHDGQGLPMLQGQLLRSLRVSGAVAGLCLLFAPTAAYALSRARFPGRRPVLVVLAVTLIAPLTLLVVPLDIVLGTVGLHNTYVGLVLAQLGLALSLTIWIMKRAFDRLPPELEECARIEGASPGRVFWRVALPSVRVSLACAVAIAFAASWGEYLFATTFLTKADHFTISAALVGASRPNLPPWDRFAPVAVLAALPSVVLFLLVQLRLRDLIQLDRLAPRPPKEESA